MTEFAQIYLEEPEYDVDYLADLYRDLLENYRDLEGKQISEAYSLALKIGLECHVIPMHRFMFKTKRMLLSHDTQALLAQAWQEQVIISKS